jgi:hypothetical protein
MSVVARTEYASVGFPTRVCTTELAAGVFVAVGGTGVAVRVGVCVAVFVAVCVAVFTGVTASFAGIAIVAVDVGLSTTPTSGVDVAAAGSAVAAGAGSSVALGIGVNVDDGMAVSLGASRSATLVTEGDGVGVARRQRRPRIDGARAVIESSGLE